MQRSYILVGLAFAIIVMLALLAYDLMEGPNWYRTFFGMSIAAFGVSVAVAVYGRREIRPGALGASIFGGIYMLNLLFFRWNLGYPTRSRNDLNNLFSEMKFAFLMWLIAALAAQLVVMICQPPPPRQPEDEATRPPKPPEKLGPLDD
ncbi:hypothetical protein ACYFX5_06320 [Bremerella sp. T1]|uniref:hypothetical protein n=1 Tax=Bremerella sp. TYQ1 TaxID=3119568 RepID=UPI001CC8EE16|nr:hypothetical protein [Bremerella volcania]UBM37873.1 hypothetical protein LA756_08260 [Bremerella volcania]